MKNRGGPELNRRMGTCQAPALTTFATAPSVASPGGVEEAAAFLPRDRVKAALPSAGGSLRLPLLRRARARCKSGKSIIDGERRGRLPAPATGTSVHLLRVPVMIPW